MAAWRSLLEAHAAVVELLERELERECGLPLSQYEVLLKLAGAPGGRLRMQELARSVLLSKSGLSRLVDRMVAAGLVCRERSLDDRRGAFAVLTEPGRAALRQAAPVHLRGIQEHFAGFLGDAEAEVIGAALGRIAAAAREVTGEGAAGGSCAPEPCEPAGEVGDSEPCGPVAALQNLGEGAQTGRVASPG
jgi:DNA-binding MarR family transcriptional regulator